MKKRKSGWYGESQRHRLAAKGIRSISKKSYKPSKKTLDPTIKNGYNTGNYYSLVLFNNDTGEERVVVIFTDDNNQVPKELLLDRFGKLSKKQMKEDLKEEAKVVFEADDLDAHTIADWWEDPTKYDIRGIDTPDAKEAYDVSGLKKNKAQQEYIAVIGGDSGERLKLREYLNDSFTSEELKKMKGTVYFITPLEDSAGRFHLINETQGSVNPIAIDPNYITKDTVVHETVHNLRKADKSRNHPLLKRPSVALAGNDNDLEESATVVETLARLDKIDERDLSYYHMMGGYRTKEADYQQIKGGCKGDKALQLVIENYDSMGISNLDLNNDGITAKQHYKKGLEKRKKAKTNKEK
jgi:hypothetical protein